MSGPTAAPNRWPYREHRTLEQVWSIPKIGRPRHDNEEADHRTAMVAGSAQLLAALRGAA